MEKRPRPHREPILSGSMTPCRLRLRPRATVPGTSSPSPTTRFIAGRALRNQAKGAKQRFFDNAGQKLRVGAGDILFAYVYMDPKNPPRELMLQWHTRGNWTHRAYWGANLVNFGKDGTPERMHLGDLPVPGRWTRLAVPVARLAMAPGTEIDGWAFTQHDGTIYWDKAGIATETPQDGQLYDSLPAWVEAQRARADMGLPDHIKKIAALEASRRSESEAKDLRATLSSMDRPGRWRSWSRCGCKSPR